MEGLLTPILLIMAGLLTGVIVKSLSKFIKLPYTVVLFAIGLLLGIAYDNDIFSGKHVLEGGIDLISTMNPDFILYVFLPILIFDAAYEMDLHVFKKTLVNSSILAVPGVVICMLLTAGLVMGMKWVLGLGYDPEDWVYALMFGGLISATDPVAVVALLQELKTSKRFSTLVDGESLLNDGTGIVCFMLFYSRFTPDVNDMSAVGFFIWVILASFVIGYFVAKLVLLFVKKACPQLILQTCIVIVAAYLTFIAAQSALAVSGVIALVVFGHIFAQSGKPHLKPEVNEFMEKFWSFLAYIANTLIFLIVGIIIATNVEVTWTSLVEIVIVYIGLNLIRYIMIAVLSPFIRRFGYGLTFKESILLGWGGLRGALGMALALMVNCNENIPQPIREKVLLYTAGAVFLTLCINGTTSKWLVNKLGLIKKNSPGEIMAWNRIVETLRNHDNKTIAKLKSDPEMEGADWDAVSEKILSESAKENISSIADQEEVTAILRRVMMEKERLIAAGLYNSGVISYDSYNRIQSAVELLSDFDGKRPLDSLDYKKLKRHGFLLMRKSTRVFNTLNLCRAYLMTQTECKALLQKLEKREFIDAVLFENAKNVIIDEMDNIIAAVKAVIDEMRKKYPEYYKKSITDKAIRVMLASERDVMEQIISDGVMKYEDVEDVMADIDRRQGLEIVE